MVQPLKYDGNDGDPLSWIVNVLEKRNEDELAIKVIDVFRQMTFEQAQANQPTIEQYNLLAKLYLDVRDVKQAEECALITLGQSRELQTTYAARANLAKMYNNINIPEKSLFYSKLNAMVDPNNPDTMLESVFSYYLLNKKDEAEKILRMMKENEDKLDEHHRDIVNFNLGTYDLEQGKFIEGLKGFMLKGRKLNIWFSPRQLPYKFWDGGVFPGKTLILFAEGGGIGDEMWAVRFMDDLKDLGFEPVFYTSRKDLYNIFNRNGYKAIMDLKNIPEDAMWTYFMQTPIYLNSNPDKVVRSNYLKPTEESRTKWKEILKEKTSKKFRVGIRWQGNSKNERDLHRKVPLVDIMRAVKSSFPEDQVDIISLQIGDGIEEIVDYPEVIDIADNIKSYDDTLALLENLDAVITSCTSVLHASAIVGVKTFALIPISAYFTWVSPPTPGRPANTSIWYDDNLRLFRQVTPKKWDEPVDELITALTALVNTK